MLEKLTDQNFILYCAKHYSNPQCNSTEEFCEDLKRLKYVKKLLTRYQQNLELKERLILNHLIVLCNLFGSTHLPRILYLKAKEQFHLIKPFLILLNVMPEKLYLIGDEEEIDTTLIPMDLNIIRVLREINDG